MKQTFIYLFVLGTLVAGCGKEVYYTKDDPVSASSTNTSSDGESAEINTINECTKDKKGTRLLITETSEYLTCDGTLWIKITKQGEDTTPQFAAVKSAAPTPVISKEVIASVTVVETLTCMNDASKADFDVWHNISLLSDGSKQVSCGFDKPSEPSNSFSTTFLIPKGSASATNINFACDTSAVVNGRKVNVSVAKVAGMYSIAKFESGYQGNAVLRCQSN